VRIGQSRRKLRRFEYACANLLDEIDVRQQRTAWVGVRIYDADYLVKLNARNLDWLQ
jgi:hypothetical protein